MEKVSLESVLDSLPISIFHYRLLFLGGLAFMADSMEVLLLSFISSCVEWNLTDQAKASIVSVVFAGSLAGSLFWGPLADMYGRKLSFIFACILIVTCGLLSAVSPTYVWLLIFRGFVGFGVGGLNVPYDLLAEFLPQAHRGSFLISIQYFWTLGSLLVSTFAWLTLSRYGWRPLTFVTSIPVAISFLSCVWYLPESPRWLLSKRRAFEAEKIVNEAASASGVKCPSYSLLPHVFDDNEGRCPQMEGSSATYLDLIGTSRLRRVSFSLWIVWSSFGFTYYGIILLVSRLYRDPSSSHQDNGDIHDSGATSCKFDYPSIFVNASAEIVGIFFAAYFIDKSRPLTQAGFYVIGGVSVLLIGFKMPFLALTIVGMIGRLCSMAASCATWAATPELYPTEMRVSGHSLCNSCARVGAMCAPYFIISSYSLFTVASMLAVVNFVAAAVSYSLPDTAGRPLDDRDPVRQDVTSPHLYSNISISALTSTNKTNGHDIGGIQSEEIGSTIKDHTFKFHCAVIL